MGGIGHAGSHIERDKIFLLQARDTCYISSAGPKPLVFVTPGADQLKNQGVITEKYNSSFRLLWAWFEKGPRQTKDTQGVEWTFQP
jgi:hypothetical protein